MLSSNFCEYTLRSCEVMRVDDFDLNDMIDFFKKDKKMKVIILDEDKDGKEA